MQRLLKMNNFQIPSEIVSELLALEDAETRLYRPSHNTFAGDAKTTIFLQQGHYWQSLAWKGHTPHEPFFKFRSPCKHPSYKSGDSWTEELGMSERTFTRMKNKVGRKMNLDAGEWWENIYETEANLFVVWWETEDRRTLYYFNEPLYMYNRLLAYKSKSDNLAYFLSKIPKGHFVLQPPKGQNVPQESKGQNVPQVTKTNTETKDTKVTKTFLRDTFLSLTGISFPVSKPTISFWWSRFRELENIFANHSPEEAERAMSNVITKMKADNLTISSPKSIENLCRAYVSKNGSHSPTGKQSLESDGGGWV